MCGAFGRALVGLGVSPFSEKGLNEALGFAVGPRTVGTREAVLDAKAGAGLAERSRPVATAVVGQDSLDGEAERSVITDRRVQERHGGRVAFIYHHAREPEPRVIVDRHVEEFPTDTAAASPPVAMN